MKITRDMLHKDLQPHFRAMSMVTRLMKIPGAIKVMESLGKRSYKPDIIKDLDWHERYIPSSDEKYQIRVKVYRPKGHQQPLPLMVYIHGGGYLTGSPDANEIMIRKFIETRPCVIIAPDYRKAPTQPFPAGFNDCYDTLLWAINNAEELAIQPDNLIVAGHSAGGGLTAAVTLKARDTQDAKIAFQMPFYPMIDDQQPYDPTRNIQSPIWDTALNRKGWSAYLADLKKKKIDIPPYAAAARNSDYKDFPPTVTFVGTADPFLQETQQYVDALKRENIDVTYKEYQGCFHGFEGLVPSAEISKDAQNFTFKSYASFYDKYIV